MFEFQKLTQDNVMIIADKWKYDGIYSFYDMTADIDDYKEFVDVSNRNSDTEYQAIFHNELVGYFSYEFINDDIELGLGLRPDYCGKGYGKDFLLQIIALIDKKEKYHQLILNVASFNKRAIKDDESCGFNKTREFMQPTNGSVYPFIEMRR